MCVYVSNYLLVVERFDCQTHIIHDALTFCFSLIFPFQFHLFLIVHMYVLLCCSGDQPLQRPTTHHITHYMHVFAYLEMAVSLEGRVG